jgi:hypothetical protein
MTLKSNHVAGGVVVAAGLIVWLLSLDLPTGRLSMPGAGMFPKLLCVLAILFGISLILRAHDSEPFREIDWSDLRHGAPVIAITVVAVALYTTLGFLITMAALLFALLMFERQNIWVSAAYSIGVTVATYALFVHVLKSPLEQGVLPF